MSVRIKLKNKPRIRKIFESEGIDYEEVRRMSQERVDSASAEDLANSLGNGGMYAIGEDEGSFKTEMLDFVNWNGELVDIKGMIEFGKRCWDDLCNGPLGIFTEVFKGRPIIWSICRDRNNPNALTTACTNEPVTIPVCACQGILLSLHKGLRQLTHNRWL